MKIHKKIVSLVMALLMLILASCMPRYEETPNTTPGKDYVSMWDYGLTSGVYLPYDEMQNLSVVEHEGTYYRKGLYSAVQGSKPSLYQGMIAFHMTCAFYGESEDLQKLYPRCDNTKIILSTDETVLTFEGERLSEFRKASSDGTPLLKRYDKNIKNITHLTVHRYLDFLAQIHFDEKLVPADTMRQFTVTLGLYEGDVLLDTPYAPVSFSICREGDEIYFIGSDGGFEKGYVYYPEYYVSSNCIPEG